MHRDRVSRILLLSSLVTLVPTLVGCGGGAFQRMPLTDIVSITDRDTGVTGLGTAEKNYWAFRETFEDSPNVTGVSQVTQIEGGQPVGLDVAPDDSVVLFGLLGESRRGQPVSQIVTKRADGLGNPTVLFDEGALNLDPVYGEDGDKIYFSSNRNNARLMKIWEIRSDGVGQRREVTPTVQYRRQPSVSRDAERVYFEGRSAGKDMIWATNINGGNNSELQEGNDPAVSPDGQRVAFTKRTGRSGSLQVWVMNQDGTAVTQLTSNEDADHVNPSWSPDGERIVYASNAANAERRSRRESFDIYMMNADGTDVTQLTLNQATDLRPVFSNNGETVFFVSNRGFNWNIWRMDIESIRATQEEFDLARAEGFKQRLGSLVAQYGEAAASLSLDVDELRAFIRDEAPEIHERLNVLGGKIEQADTAQRDRWLNLILPDQVLSKSQLETLMLGEASGTAS